MAELECTRYPEESRKDVGLSCATWTSNGKHSDGLVDSFQHAQCEISLLQFGSFCTCKNMNLIIIGLQVGFGSNLLPTFDGNKFVFVLDILHIVRHDETVPRRRCQARGVHHRTTLLP